MPSSALIFYIFLSNFQVDCHNFPGRGFCSHAARRGLKLNSSEEIMKGTTRYLISNSKFLWGFGPKFELIFQFTQNQVGGMSACLKLGSYDLLLPLIKVKIKIPVAVK